jgi:hypothetical protein
VNDSPHDAHEPPVDVIVLPGYAGLGALSDGSPNFVI